MSTVVGSCECCCKKGAWRTFWCSEASSRCRPWSARVNAAVKRVHGLTFWCSEANLSSFIGFVVFWSKSELDGGDDASAL
jgi:hypothetical protein